MTQGKKQSELTVKILGNDGKELKEGQDINVTMHDGKISVNVINPKRGKSGTFKVIGSRFCRFSNLVPGRGWEQPRRVLD